MTLRLRLLAIIGLSFSLLWGAMSVWMLLDLRTEFRNALDERLAASAHMVAGLLAQMPQVPQPPYSLPHDPLNVVTKNSVACEISLLRGDVVARTQNSPSGLGQTKPGYDTRTIQDQQWRTYTLEHGGMRITTADRLDRRAALLHDIVVATAVPFLVAMFGSLGVLWFGIRKGLAPLETIRRALGERTPDALHPISENHIPAELTPLVHTINVLLDRTGNAIERERRFTGDAAHELRTPLTAIKTHIQVARISDPAGNAVALAHAEEGVLRLQRTLEQLMTLTRLDGHFSFDDGVASTVQTVVRLAMKEIPAEMSTRVRIDDNDTELTLAVSPSLAAMALRNLIDNALRYSKQDAPVILKIVESADFVCFQIMDEGPGMSDEDRAYATRRFWRKGPGQGSGLGLSIVDAITRNYGGEFTLRARPEQGMLVQIKLPRILPDHTKQ